ncbi:MAG: phosphotransferase family protein [Jatrophihabitantaceae bacterium]
MTDGLDDVRLILPGVHIERGEELGGSDRSEVRRLRARWPDGPATSVIVKRFHGAGEGWVREAAALASVSESAPTARLIAEGATPPLLVTGDLGPGPSVADALLGDDPAEATEAVLQWSAAIAALHRVTLGGRDAFRAALGLRSGDMPVATSALPAFVDEGVRLLDSRCLGLGVDVPSGALSQLRELPRRLGGVDGAAALSPADACPDNNVRTADGLLLLDFEGAEFRHVAWDVAYLLVPWPSCWCAWRMPREVSERALERYRATIAADLPYVREPQFRLDIAAAAIGWAMISTAEFLPRALADDPPPRDPGKVTPTRRAMILHRLDGARRDDQLPALAELARRLRAELVHRWGEVSLSYAPAFTGD